MGAVFSGAGHYAGESVDAKGGDTMSNLEPPAEEKIYLYNHGIAHTFKEWNQAFNWFSGLPERLRPTDGCLFIAYREANNVTTDTQSETGNTDSSD